MLSIRVRALLPILGFILLSIDTSALPSRGRDHSAAPEESHLVGIYCSPNGTRCWSEGKLLHSNGQCHPPLTRGPCPDGQWWVLDRNGSRASIRGKCVALGCPPNSRSRACRRLMQEFAQACPRLPSGDPEFAVHMNPMGEFRCGVTPGGVQSLHDFVRCFSRPVAWGDLGGNVPSAAVVTNGIRCAQNDDGHCGSLVLGSQPNITLSFED